MTTAEPKRIPTEAVLAPMLVVGALFVALLPDAVPRIACVFRMLTDLPCLACGSTRAVLALGRFDFATAFRMNPATSVLALGAVFYVLRAPLVMVGWLKPMRSPFTRPVLYAGGVLLAINWVYLIIAGR